MTLVTALLNKAIRIGPLPYLAFCIVVLALGVVFQLRSANPVMPDGSTIFGLFARIGGFVGLFGLVPLVLAVREEGDTVDDDRSRSDQRDAHPDACDQPGSGRVMRVLTDVILDKLPRRTA